MLPDKVGRCDKVVDSCNTSLPGLWLGHEIVSPVTLHWSEAAEGLTAFPLPARSDNTGHRDLLFEQMSKHGVRERTQSCPCPDRVMEKSHTLLCHSLSPKGTLPGDKMLQSPSAFMWELAPGWPSTASEGIQALNPRALYPWISGDSHQGSEHRAASGPDTKNTDQGAALTCISSS